MKRHIFGMMAAAVLALTFTSCSEEQGTEPGSDPSANITLYQYQPSSPYDADADRHIRIAANSKVKEAYILCEDTASYAARLQELGENGYAEYVKSNGSRLADISGASSADSVFTNLGGTYVFSVVAVANNGSLVRKQTSFTGIAWMDVAEGTMSFPEKSVFADFGSVTTVLQQRSDNPSQYRIKDMFKTGYHLLFTTHGETLTDEEGFKYKLATVPKQDTGYTYGSYGSIYVADIATYDADASYQSYVQMYEDGSCVFYNYEYVTAGSIGYGYYIFYPSTYE